MALFNGSVIKVKEDVLENEKSSEDNEVYVLHLPKFVEELLRKTGNPDNIKFKIVERLPEESNDPKDLKSACSGR